MTDVKLRHTCSAATSLLFQAAIQLTSIAGYYADLDGHSADPPVDLVDHLLDSTGYSANSAGHHCH